METFNIWFEELERNHIHLTPEQRSKIEHRINDVLTYEPKIGVFGKTGAGKSSLCNALFGTDVCPINDVEACTRNTQEVILNMGGKGIKLLDVPGVGENQTRDTEYAQLYSSLLPELDLVLWLIKADERALSSDEMFYKNIVRPHMEEKKPFFIVISQAEKIEPFREWRAENHEPGPQQLLNLEHKADFLAQKFGLPRSRVIVVSSNEKYNLVRLVDEIVYTLPKEKNVTFYHAVSDELKTEQTKKFVEEGFWETLVETISTVVTVGKEVMKLAKKAYAIVRSLLSF